MENQGWRTKNFADVFVRGSGLLDGRRLKLLFVIDHLSSGGAQRQLVLLAGRLAERGHRVEVVAYRRHEFFAGELERQKVKLTVLTKGWRYSPSFVLRLARLMRNESYDAVLSYLTAANFYSLMARWLAGVSTPVIVSERSAANNPHRGWRESFVERFYQRADTIVLNSHHLRDHYAERQPKLVERLATIWNGVDLESFTANPLPVDEQLKLVAVGQLGRFKQPDLIIRALAILRDEYGITPRLTWFLRRYPNLQPSEQTFLGELNRLLETTGIGKQWNWRPETDTLSRELPSFHAMVHASTVEGLPNAICEALATGRPVIATDVLDHPRLVEDGQTGFLFRAGDAAALAAAIARFAKLKTAERQTMGNAARAFAETRLSADRFADEYQALFFRLARLKGGSSAS